MKRVIAIAVAAISLTGCAVSYTAHPTDEKRKPNCVQLQRREGKSFENVGLYCRVPATTTP